MTGATTPAGSRRRARGAPPARARPSRRHAGAPFSSGTSASARARARTSRSVTVTPASGGADACARMHAVRHQLAADVDVRDLLPARGDVRHDGARSAVVARRARRGRSAAGRGGDVGATMRPPGPEPGSDASSTPRSRARRRAAGDAIGPVRAARRDAGRATATGAGVDGRRRASGSRRRPLETASRPPARPARAPRAPPRRRRSRPRRRRSGGARSPGASISTVALSVSTSTTGWPADDRARRPRRASGSPSPPPSRWRAAAQSPRSCDEALDGGDDVVGAG